MKTPSKLETTLYLAAFITVLTIAMLMIFYLDGRTDEALRETGETSAMLDQAIADGDYWHEKYQHLAAESDGITILAAEAKFENAAGARQ